MCLLICSARKSGSKIEVHGFSSLSTIPGVDVVSDTLQFTLPSSEGALNLFAANEEDRDVWVDATKGAVREGDVYRHGAAVGAIPMPGWLGIVAVEY